MAEADSWKDQRSTSRKHLRKNLLIAISEGHNNHLYACERCGKGPKALPYSSYWDSTWTIELPPLDMQEEGVYLDADHKDKDWTNNDAGNGELLCRKCHLAKDRQTGRGIDPNSDDLFGYASTFVLSELVETEDPNFIAKGGLSALPSGLNEGFEH